MIYCKAEKRYLRHGGRFAPAREVMHMVTYDELFQFVIMLCAVIGIAYGITKKK